MSKYIDDWLAAYPHMENQASHHNLVDLRAKVQELAGGLTDPVELTARVLRWVEGQANPAIVLVLSAEVLGVGTHEFLRCVMPFRRQFMSESFWKGDDVKLKVQESFFGTKLDNTETKSSPLFVCLIRDEDNADVVPVCPADFTALVEAWEPQADFQPEIPLQLVPLIPMFKRREKQSALIVSG